MIRFFAGLALTLTFCATVSSQTYWVESADVGHAGGWPNIHVDTTTGRPPRNGYILDFDGLGGQHNPGGLQEDLSHDKVDAYYSLGGNLSILGQASGSAGYAMLREDIGITFKVRCANVGMPPAPGLPVFDIRCLSEAAVYLAVSPNYNYARATCYYIAPAASLVSSWIAEAEIAGGNLNDFPGWTAHRTETGPLPPGWVSVGTNLWETTVTVPVPTDPLDQDVTIDLDADGFTPGSIGTAFSSGFTRYEFRCTDLGIIPLQAPF